MPLTRCKVKGRLGWKWRASGKCYLSKAKALHQMKAILAIGWTENAKKPRRKNPLKLDPTRTITIRRMFQREMTRRFNLLKKDIHDLVVTKDAFDLNPKPDYLTGNTNQVANVGRFAFATTPQKLEAFRKWLKRQVEFRILGDELKSTDDWWQEYVKQGYDKGAGRAFDDTRPQVREFLDRDPESVSDFYAGTREEFLRSAFARPVSIEKVKLLAGRVYTDVKGVTDAMSTKLARRLTDGMAQGENPRVIARDLDKFLDAYKNQGLTVARTEITRAHAEGQLDAMERLGVEEVGVMVEWSTAEDEKVCDRCQPLEGVVFKIEEARGLIPRHPNCRCAHIPANIGESTKGQIRGKRSVEKAMDDSIEAEGGKNPRQKTTWMGADRDISKARPKSVLDNVFCPTGEGGGVDPTCPAGGGSRKSVADTTGENQFDSLWKAQKLRFAQDPKRIKAVLKYRVPANTSRKPDDPYNGELEGSLLNNHYFGMMESAEINADLRNGRIRPYVKKIIAEYDHLSAPLPHDLTVYRAVPSVGVLGKNLKVGDILEDKGFISTTASKKYLDSFNPLPTKAMPEVKTKEVVGIRIPKEVKVVLGDNERPGFRKLTSEEMASGKFPSETTVAFEKKSEYEILLRPGTRFRVVSLGINTVLEVVHGE